MVPQLGDVRPNAEGADNPASPAGRLSLDALPPLCLDVISKHLCARYLRPTTHRPAQPTRRQPKRSKPAEPDLPTDTSVLGAARLAACLARVGSPACTRLSVDLYDAVVDPGCKAARDNALTLNTKKRSDWADELTRLLPSKGSKAPARKDRLVQLLALAPISARRCPVRPRARRLLAAMRTPDKRITATRARSEFKVNDKELDTLPVDTAPNPHYRCAAPMRLYNKVDVIRLSNKKHPELDKDYWAGADPEEVQAEQEQKQKRAVKRERSKESLKGRREAELDDMCKTLGITVKQVRKELESYNWEGEKAEFELDRRCRCGRGYRDDEYHSSDDEYMSTDDVERPWMLEEAQSKKLNAFAKGSRTVSKESVMQVLSSLKARIDRRAQLVAALSALGCELRSDSRLCENYIRSGWGDPQDIAIIMREMQFYFDHTDYETFRDQCADELYHHKGYLGDDMKEEASEDGKREALEEWAAQFSSWQEAAARPELPDSLRKHIQSVWSKARRHGKQKKRRLDPEHYDRSCVPQCVMSTIKAS